MCKFLLHHQSQFHLEVVEEKERGTLIRLSGSCLGYGETPHTKVRAIATLL